MLTKSSELGTTKPQNEQTTLAKSNIKFVQRYMLKSFIRNKFEINRNHK